MNACQKCVFAVNDDNPHCGLRGFRNDFNVKFCSAENNTLPNGFELQSDGYFSWVEKKKEYPKTYKECLVITTYDKEERILYLLEKFKQLLICRDAYWKIAGEEMGLGKPWELSIGSPVYYIYYNRTLNHIKKDYADDIHGNIVLAFPTEEMRDAFYENFEKEIEICKELL